MTLGLGGSAARCSASRARRSVSRTDQAPSRAERASRRRAAWSLQSRIARPWPSLRWPRLDQLERLLGQVEQADQVRDRDPAAADPAPDLLLGEAEVVDEHRAGARLLDGVEVLRAPCSRRGRGRAAPSRRPGAAWRGSARARRSARRAGGARRRPARSGRRPAAARRSAAARRARGSSRPARPAWSRRSVLRGWRGFGSIRSTGISRRPSSSPGRGQDRGEASAHAAAVIGHGRAPMTSSVRIRSAHHFNHEPRPPSPI